jgi:monoamine oxidase
MARTPLLGDKAILSLPKKSDLFRASYSFYRVGQYTAFAGYEAVRQGGVLFCGEHTSIDFQGFMEGGASEGKRAAKELKRIIRGGE